MATLIRLPSNTNAFSDYRPSKNAHIDFLSANALGKRRQSADDGGPRMTTLDIQLKDSSPPVEAQLATLLDAIPSILAGNPTKESYHSLSAICHKLVLPPHKKGPEIYERVREGLQQSVAGLVREWRGSIMGREGGWLAKLVAGWRSWEKRVGLLSSILVYLDKLYCGESSKLLPMRKLAIEAFRIGAWDNEILYSKTGDDLLAWASAEREAGTPDAAARPTVIAVILLSELLSRSETLAELYIDLVSTYYTDTTANHLESVESGTMSPIRYVEWLTQSLEEEEERAKTCFDDVRAHDVVDIILQEGGEKVRDRFVKRALDEAMDQSNAEALIKLYKLVVRCKSFDTFKKSLQDHIENRVRKIISDPANDPQMIDGTLNLKRFVDQSLRSLFEPLPKVDDRNYQQTWERGRQLELEDGVRVGFRAGMGSRQNAPAEWIAKHLDSAMRKGQGSDTEAEFNALLDEITALIGFTRDKDVFKAFYSSGLAKRLLLNKSASDDMERNMILKLQNEMGEEFTSGDIMMKDLTLSDTLVKAYQSAQAKNPEEFKDAGNFTANVLTESAWPAYPLLKDGWNFKLTPDLQSSIDQFTKWYATQHKNRQLSWRWQLGTVSLTARFPSGKYEVGVSLFQAVTMMQFNEEDTLTFKDLKDRTGIEQSELVRTVQSLSLGRKGTRVLLKKPPGREVKPDDVFAWNKQFTSERIKFRINQIQQDMSAEESRKTNEQVAIDRVSVLEATIVRIMKARKKMTLQLLIDAVVSDVSKRFPPDVKEIKKRMESLIEREFLMRDEDDRNLLHYLA